MPHPIIDVGFDEALARGLSLGLQARSMQDLALYRDQRDAVEDRRLDLAADRDQNRWERDQRRLDQYDTAESNRQRAIEAKEAEQQRARGARSAYGSRQYQLYHGPAPAVDDLGETIPDWAMGQGGPGMAAPPGIAAPAGPAPAVRSIDSMSAPMGVRALTDDEQALDLYKQDQQQYGEMFADLGPAERMFEVKQALEAVKARQRQHTMRALEADPTFKDNPHLQRLWGDLYLQDSGARGGVNQIMGTPGKPGADPTLRMTEFDGLFPEGSLDQTRRGLLKAAYVQRGYLTSQDYGLAGLTEQDKFRMARSAQSYINRIDRMNTNATMGLGPPPTPEDMRRYETSLRILDDLLNGTDGKQGPAPASPAPAAQPGAAATPGTGAAGRTLEHAAAPQAPSTPAQAIQEDAIRQQVRQMKAQGMKPAQIQAARTGGTPYWAHSSRSTGPSPSPSTAAPAPSGRCRRRSPRSRPTHCLGRSSTTMWCCWPARPRRCGSTGSTVGTGRWARSSSRAATPRTRSIW